MNCRHSLISALLLALVIPLETAPLKASQTDAFTGLTVLEVVTTLRDSVQGVIASLDSLTGNALFQSRQHLELLLTQLEVVTDGVLDTTFDSLDRAERQFFVDVNNQITALKELERVTAEDVNRVTTNISNGFTNLPFAKSFPLIFDYDPVYTLNGGDANSDTINVSFKGVLLGSGEPSLTFGDTHCSLSTKIDTKLTFTCNRNLFLAYDTIKSTTGKLHVFQRQGFLARLFGGQGKKFEYNLSINVVPELAGIVKTTVWQETPTLQSQQRNSPFDHRNAHCQGAHTKVFQFNATNGWQIVPSSVSASCNHSSESSCNGTVNITSFSFGYSCTIANNGTCGPFWRDGRGSCRGNVSWREVRSNTQINSQELDIRELFWGKDIQISLPQNTVNVSISVAKTDGSRRIFTANDISDPWFNVEVNLQDGYITLRPASLDQALN